MAETRQQKLAREMSHKQGAVNQSARDNPLTGSALQALARGWAAGTLGMPGDIEGLGRAGIRMLGADVDKYTALPNTDYFKQALPGKQVGDENIATIGSLFGGAGLGTAAKGARTVAKAVPGALTQIAKNASVPRTLSPQAGVIKAPGGNWLSGSVEDALKGLKPRVRTEGINGHTAQDTLADQAMGQFIDKQLTRYVKNDMATERDPIRALAERGVLHVDPEAQYWSNNFVHPSGEHLEKLATARLAQRWENATDNMLRESPASTYQNFGSSNLGLDWVNNLNPEAPFYRPKDDTVGVNLGFNHLIDELRNATNPNSGLPRELLLKPESLDRVSVPQAVEHVAKINAWREAQKVAANEAIANNAATHLFKEYSENNPKGLKWVELKQPDALSDDHVKLFDADARIKKSLGDDPAERGKRLALEDALKYEGDTMGHCVGGYCDDVASGRSRIYSLRDAKGQPHVTVEVKPEVTKSWAERLASKEYDSVFDQAQKELGFVGDEHLSDSSKMKALSTKAQEIASSMYGEPEITNRIIQIKGKGNKKPNDEYLPFVQDFVKSGKWSDVRDLQNTGLTKHASGYLTADELRALGNPPKFAQGGPVPTAAEIQQFYAAHKDDPAALAAAMREHNVGTATAAQALGQTQEQLVNHINSGRVATPVMTGGPDPAATGAQTWNYEAITPEATQTLEQFKQKYAHAIGPDGRFKGPQSGIDYAAEGQTPEEYYKANIGQQYQRSGEYGSEQTPTKFNTTVNADWRKGPDNGGGVLGGVTRAVGGIAKGVMSNPALSMALGAGLAPMVTGGLRSAGLSAGMAKTATPLVTSGLKTVAGGGSLADVAKNAGISYLGGQAGELTEGATGLDIAGKAASTLTQSALRGKPLSLNALATQYAMGQLTDLSGLDPKMASIVINLAKNKRPSVVGALSTIANVAGRRKTGARPVGG